MPVFTVLVKDTNPIWFYCATGKHCQSGMSGVINAPASAAKTLALYKESAKAVVLTGVPSSSPGTGGDDNASSGTPAGNSSSPTSTGQPEITQANPNAGSTMVASSAFALIAAAVVAALTL